MIEFGPAKSFFTSDMKALKPKKQSRWQRLEGGIRLQQNAQMPEKVSKNYSDV